MNANSYRLIFSKHQGMLVPVSEQATAQHKGRARSAAAKRGKSVAFLAKVLALSIYAVFSAPTFALPTDPTVVNGTATFNQAGQVLTVTNSAGAVINWQTFNIGAGETTHFLQSSASSAVLNQVVTNNASALYGTLSSNGIVWLVNQAGIMVGPGAVIDTAGFVASTLKIRPEDFLAGQLHFQATAGAADVVNKGEIRTPSGGFAYLIGTNVSNEGIITTPNGETILAAGNTVSLIDTGTPGVKVDITGAANNATNLGSIVAAAGRIGIAGSLVKNSGTLDASSVVNEGGRIFLKASQDTYVDGNGRIVATGTKGGQVEVLGNRVAVMDNAEINASGTTGGGTILVGGDYLGGNPDVQNAWITYFGPNASLKANATDNGNGGKVIVWADDTTRAYGSIEAKGGPNGGNGGFVETSGHRYLDVEGIQVDTSAASGIWGSWLLDPAELTISYGGATSANITGTFLTTADTPATLSWQTIASALTGAVTVTTGSYGGSIIFNQPSSDPIWSTTYGGNLSFVTTGSISGNWGGTQFAQPVTGLRLQTAGNISFQGDAGVFLGNGKVETTGYGGSISVTSSNGSVGIGLLKAPGNITINAKYSIWDNNWQSTGAAGVNIESGGAVNLTSVYGGDPGSSCTPGPCQAISADISGNPTSITVQANTSSSANAYGGVGITFYGDAPSGNIILKDFSTGWMSNSNTENYVEFEATGNMALGAGDEFYTIGGGIWLDAGGDLTLGGATIGGTPSEIGSFAGGTLTIGQALTVSNTSGIWDPGLYLLAGSQVNVNANLVSAGNISIASGVTQARMDQIDATNSDDQMTNSEFLSYFSGVGGTVNVGGTLQAEEWVGILGGNVTVGAAITAVNGGISLGASGLLDINSALTSTYGGIAAGGLNVNVDANVSAYGGIALGASGTLKINSAVTTSYGGLTVGGQIVDVYAPISSPNGTMTLFASGVLDIDNIYGGPVTVNAGNTLWLIAPTIYVDSTVYGSSNIGITANDYSSYGGTLWAQGPSSNIEGIVANNIKLDNSFIKAGDDVSLALLGGASELQFYNGSKIEADIDNPQDTTIYLDFLGRPSGGIYIDGIEATTGQLGSVFWNAGGPATGSGLQIAYGVVPDALATILNVINNSTTTTEENSSTTPLITTSSTSTGFQTNAGGTTGEGEGEFGGPPADSDKPEDKPKDEDAKAEREKEKAAKKKLARCG